MRRLILLLLLLATPSLAAITYVGGASVAADSITQVIPYAATPGNYLVVGIQSGECNVGSGHTAAVAAITDDGANTYTTVITRRQTALDSRASIQVAPVITATTTITAYFDVGTCVSTSIIAVIVAEYAGVQQVGANTDTYGLDPPSVGLLTDAPGSWAIMMAGSDVADSTATLGSIRAQKLVFDGTRTGYLVESTVADDYGYIDVALSAGAITYHVAVGILLAPTTPPPPPVLTPGSRRLRPTGRVQ